MEGPTRFALLNVWAQLPRYEEDVVNCVRAARRVLPSDLPLVVAGDFNSCPAVRSQGRSSQEMFRTLRQGFGLVSAYHHYFGVEPGQESHPTFYMHRRQARPFHIDYCFVPESWAEWIAAVEVGSYSEWKDSDHRLATFDLAV